MFYVPKAIKAIFLSALIGTISVRQSHQFPWGFQPKCALPFLFVFTLQPATKRGSESAYKWAGERPGDLERQAGERGAGRGPWLHCAHSKGRDSRGQELWFLSWDPGVASASKEAQACCSPRRALSEIPADSTRAVRTGVGFGPLYSPLPDQNLEQNLACQRRPVNIC